MLDCRLGAIHQRNHDAKSRLLSIRVILPSAIRLPYEGDQVVETLCWLQRPSCCNQVVPAIMDTVLKSFMQLLDCLKLGHIKVLNVGIINKECVSNVQRGLSYGEGQMQTVSLSLVSPNHGNIGDCPAHQGGSVPLTHSLSFFATG